jgi:hypothetical protein
MTRALAWRARAAIWASVRLGTFGTGGQPMLKAREPVRSDKVRDLVASALASIRLTCSGCSLCSSGSGGRQGTGARAPASLDRLSCSLTASRMAFRGSTRSAAQTSGRRDACRGPLAARAPPRHCHPVLAAALPTKECCSTSSPAHVERDHTRSRDSLASRLVRGGVAAVASVVLAAGTTLSPADAWAADANRPPLTRDTYLVWLGPSNTLPGVCSPRHPDPPFAAPPPQYDSGRLLSADRKDRLEKQLRDSAEYVPIIAISQPFKYTCTLVNNERTT